jgi:carbamoyl-phosphate synthase large subunit
MVVNTPYGVGGRVDGYEIRSVAVRLGIPCITTVQGLSAAVEGIESLLGGEMGVRSLQQHGHDLDLLRAADLAATRVGSAT